MALPVGNERLVFAGDTQKLPIPLRGNDLEVGYLETRRRQNAFRDVPRVQQNVTLRYILVTHALVDRTFCYRVHWRDATALFIPENKVRPHVELGDWYYGPREVYRYIRTNGHRPDLPQGIVYVRRSARVWWCVEGVSPASQTGLAVRPVYWSGGMVPIEFRGHDRDDCCTRPPKGCDEF